METMRLVLIFLHTIIIIFSAVDLHSLLNFASDASNHQDLTTTILRYSTSLICLSLYHITSILAVWFSRQYGAGIIRATGILLVGELVQAMASVVQLIIKTGHLKAGELSFIVIFNLLVLITVLMTFRLAEKLSKREKILLQVELLADTVHDIPIDDNIEPSIL